jgi:acetyl-CoA carboxylase carboxyltransferase component
LPQTAIEESDCGESQVLPCKELRVETSVVYSMTELSLNRCVEQLLDPGTFQPLYACTASENLVGVGRIESRLVAVAGVGALGPHELGMPDRPLARERLLRMQELSARERCPIVYIYLPANNQGSASWKGQFPAEMTWGTRGIPMVWRMHCELSGVVPQVGILLGSVSNPRAFPCALCDALVMVDHAAALYLGTPEQTLALTGEVVNVPELGGARVHCAKTGTADALAPSPAEAVGWGRKYLGYMPSHAGSFVPLCEPRMPQPSGRSSAELIPKSTAPMDMHAILREVIDAESLLEVKALFSPEVITAFARIDGRAVGIVANNSTKRGGVMFVSSCDKVVRFISLCDTYGIPLVFMADATGFMVGKDSNQQGIVASIAKLFLAICDATVPKVSIVVRKAYTTGIHAMGGRPFPCDAYFAVEGASMSTMASTSLRRSHANDSVRMAKSNVIEALSEQTSSGWSVERLASELLIDGIIRLEDVRTEISRQLSRSPQRHAVERRKRIWPM